MTDDKPACWNLPLRREWAKWTEWAKWAVNNRPTMKGQWAGCERQSMAQAFSAFRHHYTVQSKAHDLQGSESAWPGPQARPDTGLEPKADDCEHS